MDVTVTLSMDDLAIILACVSEVDLEDARLEQFDLKRRLTKVLRENAKDYYDDLVRTGKIDAIARFSTQ